jgi:hypothetical protein
MTTSIKDLIIIIDDLTRRIQRKVKNLSELPNELLIPTLQSRSICEITTCDGIKVCASIIHALKLGPAVFFGILRGHVHKFLVEGRKDASGSGL